MHGEQHEERHQENCTRHCQEHISADEQSVYYLWRTERFNLKGVTTTHEHTHTVFLEHEKQVAAFSISSTIHQMS